MLPWLPVISGIVSAHRVLLLGPDDEARRALHLTLDRAGKQVAAMSDLDAARRYLAANDCDAVIAAPGLAAELAAEPGAPPVLALVRSRELALARELLDAGVEDVL